MSLLHEVAIIDVAVGIVSRSKTIFVLRCDDTDWLHIDCGRGVASAVASAVGSQSISTGTSAANAAATESAILLEEYRAVCHV